MIIWWSPTVAITGSQGTPPKQCWCMGGVIMACWWEKVVAVASWGCFHESPVWAGRTNPLWYCSQIVNSFNVQRCWLYALIYRFLVTSTKFRGVSTESCPLDILGHSTTSSSESLLLVKGLTKKQYYILYLFMCVHDKHSSQQQWLFPELPVSVDCTSKQQQPNLELTD